MHGWARGAGGEERAFEGSLQLVLRVLQLLHLTHCIFDRIAEAVTEHACVYIKRSSLKTFRCKRGQMKPSSG